MNTKLKTLKALAARLNPGQNPLTRSLLLAAVALVVTSPAFAQSGIPIVDGILDLIDQWKPAIVMLGVALIAVGLLGRKILPESVADNRAAITSMVIGGVLLTQLDTITNLIIGA
jgi:hypothetical protein